MAQYVYQNNPVQADSTLSKVATVTSGVQGLLLALDRALHPERYAVPQANIPVNNGVPPKQSGFGGVAKWLLIAGLGGGAIYVGKELLEQRKEKDND